MVETSVERFVSMGTRVELHLFGPVADDVVRQARRAIEAVDDALTIHRPSPVTSLNESLGAGEAAAVTDPLLQRALLAVDGLHDETGGLFDPAVGAGGWSAVSLEDDAAQVVAARPVMLDFGGFGKGFALDRAVAVLREGGVSSAFLSAGESSIAVIGEHPLGGKWLVAIPDPRDPDAALVELELEDEALSVSSTLGGGDARAASLRPADGAAVTAPRTCVAIAADGGAAEAWSTALLVAQPDEARRWIAAAPTRRFAFALGDAMSFRNNQMMG